LDDIAGDNVVMRFHFRKEDGSFAEEPFEFPIRLNGKPLYVKHPEVDVAAQYMRMPALFQKVEMLNIGLLGQDDFLTRFE
ncbi:hypothetical protein ABTM57_20765, partial [Acinetobacter baumannii]